MILVDRNHVMRRAMAIFAMVFTAALMLFAPVAQAAGSTQDTSGARVLEAFDRQQVQRVNGDGITDHKKHVIVFLIGVPLILMLMITGGLGIAMGVFGKQQLFLPHMILAGLTMTLALVHVVVTVVWFYPF